VTEGNISNVVIASQARETVELGSGTVEFIMVPPELSRLELQEKGRCEMLIQMEGELFEAVQSRGVFDDSKTFVDCELRRPPEEILADYYRLRNRPDFDLKLFVDHYFDSPMLHCAPTLRASQLPKDPEERIQQLWTVLKRTPDSPRTGSTRIVTSYPYIVPGGRFRESYYWDTYFTALGLAATGQIRSVVDLARGQAELISRFGRIPNGHRAYYLSRSQPPFFVFIVALIERTVGLKAVSEFVDALLSEHDFWMDQERRGQVRDNCRVLRLPSGERINRYWDELYEPRPESWREDTSLASRLPEEKRSEFYRNRRAACESGWDFSSRWHGDPAEPESIRTTHIIPVDLNSLLYFLEAKLAEWLRQLNRSRESESLALAASERRDTLRRVFWEDTTNYFHDYDLDRGTRSSRMTLAGIAPLFAGAATSQQADSVAEAIQGHFLKHGGLVTTIVASPTGEQWDFPNGWAPLQWMAVIGLGQYGHFKQAVDVAQRFCLQVEKVYRETGRFMEKYDVVNSGAACGGGEYPNQDGFGWTNGVYIALKRFLNGPLRPGTEAFHLIP